MPVSSRNCAPKTPGRAGGDEGVEGVGAEQAQAGCGPGARTEGRAGEDVDRAGVLVVLAQPHEDVGDQQHRHRRQEERQRRRPADQPGRALRVDVGRHARRHQGDRDADGLPDREAPTEAGCCLRGGCHGITFPSPCPRAARCGTPYDASVEHVADLDQTERDARAAAAPTLLGPSPKAASWASPRRSSTTPASPGSRPCRWIACPHLAAWGVGSSISFDRFRFDDWIAGAGEGREAVGDLRVMPDVRRVVPLAASPGGRGLRPTATSRTARRTTSAAGCCWPPSSAPWLTQGITMKAAVELEWVIGKDVEDDSDDDFRPAARGPAYGMARLVDALRLLRRPAGRARGLGRRRRAVPPGVRARPAGALGRGGGPRGCGRHVRARAHGHRRASARGTAYRTSFSPKVEVPGVGNGGHVHFSLWRDRART